MDDMWLSQKDFDYIYKRVHRLCADLIIKNDKGILLTKRMIPPAEGKWHFPGGTVYIGETIEQAVKRIAKAELNVEVEIIKDVGFMEFVTKEEVYGKPVSIAFLVKIVSGEIKGSEQAMEIEFFEKLPENMMVDQKKFLRDKLGFEIAPPGFEPGSAGPEPAILDHCTTGL